MSPDKSADALATINIRKHVYSLLGGNQARVLKAQQTSCMGKYWKRSISNWVKAYILVGYSKKTIKLNTVYCNDFLMSCNLFLLEDI